jgi:hypothetical protein
MSQAKNTPQPTKVALQERRSLPERQAVPEVSGLALEMGIFSQYTSPQLNQLIALRRTDTTTRIHAFKQLQQQHGNRTIQRLMNSNATAREHVRYLPTMLTIQRSPGTQAEQEAEAAQTITLLNTILPQMQNHPNKMVRDTAVFFTAHGSEPARLTYDAMTPRSDSDSLVTGAGRHTTEEKAFFYGPTQNNQHFHSRTATGTVEGNKVLVRRLTDDGREQATDAIIGTFTHETSHALVVPYGVFPTTSTDAASFDRYKDEFRAYWIEPVGYWAGLQANDDKARTIRQHIVGTSATNTTGYPDLHNRYWNPAETAFKTDVDNYLRPEGYNLGNNPNLDRLFQLLHGIRTAATTIDDTVNHIVTRMSQSERTEAYNAPLIRQQYNALLEPERDRIIYSFRFTFLDEYVRQIDPSGNPRIAALYSAIISSTEDAIKDSYQQLNPSDRERIRSAMAALLTFIDIQINESFQRASIYAMITSGQVNQYDAMNAFLEACMDVQFGQMMREAIEEPTQIRSTLRALTYESRLTLYRLLEYTRRMCVDSLPDPLNTRVLNALREGGEL